MAVFPTLSDTATAEYEMTMVFHENGVVSDMHIDYHSFSVRQKGERVGRNPKTGVEVPILPRKVLVFRASHVLKEAINKATASSNVFGDDAGGGSY